jgi:hypothetical protein
MARRFTKILLPVLAGGITEVIITELLTSVFKIRTTAAANNSLMPGLSGSIFGLIVGLTDLLRSKRPSIDSESTCQHRISEIHLTTESGGQGNEDGAVCILCGEVFSRGSCLEAPNKS